MWFATEVLDVQKRYVWSKMREISDSVRDNKRTVVRAGHGVSKTSFAGRLALAFLYSHPPSTVVTTAPTRNQVKDLLWREIREAHGHAKMPLVGEITSQMLDLQKETGTKYFALGVATKPDTVTKEATGFQGYHNQHVLIIFDEAAGVCPEIWRAAESLMDGAFVRFLAIGNATSGTGDFARCFKDPDYNKIVVSVLDTPNYKEGRMVIPGVYGRDFEQRIASKHGRDSDEYAVRVLGGISEKATLGSYYGKVLADLESQGRIGDIGFTKGIPVHVVCDPGYTTPWWLYQIMPDGWIHVIRFYEDSGMDMSDYSAMLDRWK